VLRVIVTHLHPDHVGLASWLTQRWSTPDFDCRLWMSNGDWNAARLATLSNAGPGGEQAAPFFALHGLPQAKKRSADGDSEGDRSNYFSSLVPSVPTQYRRLIDGMRVSIDGREWLCIDGHGHAPEHIALHCAELGVLISGDMVLPRISTNVSVFPLEPEGDPLALYLASIQRYNALPASTLVLPSHGKPFTGLHTRVAQLLQHHEERFADVLAACATTPHSAADLLQVLFRRQLDAHQMSFAMGESIAHVNALLSKGQLQGSKGDDGVMRFTAVQAVEPCSST
jgi:glyoxylase-like metal-dependent hydrolase (beta-lactamase superfamily II)